MRDCRQLKIDVESYNENYNENYNESVPVQTWFDFTEDLEELEHESEED